MTQPSRALKNQNLRSAFRSKTPYNYVLIAVITLASTLFSVSAKAAIKPEITSTNAPKSNSAEIEEPANTKNTDSPSPAKLITVGRIDGESSKKMSVVTIRLSKKPEWKKIPLEDHGTFLQIKLPNSIVPDPGSFFDGNSPYIKKIAAFQNTATTASIRIFLSKNAALTKQATSAQILGSRVVITVDHSALKAILSENAAQETKRKTIKATEQTNVGTTQKNNQQKTTNLERTTNTALGSEGTHPDSASYSRSTEPSPAPLKDKMIEISVFLGLMIFFLLATLSIKPLMRKRRMKVQGESFVEMNLLSNLSLAPKQKLSLVQIGNEQILVAVTPDSINFISKIGEEAYQKQHETLPSSSLPRSQLPETIRQAFRSPALPQSESKPPFGFNNAQSQNKDPEEQTTTRASAALESLRKRTSGLKGAVKKGRGRNKSHSGNNLSSEPELGRPPAKEDVSHINRGGVLEYPEDQESGSFAEFMRRTNTPERTENSNLSKKKEQRTLGSRINVQISDDGVKNRASNQPPIPKKGRSKEVRSETKRKKKKVESEQSLRKNVPNFENDDSSSVDDVTRLIREKLRSLPRI